ncbi:MAG: flagellar biosynthetic protein FliR [bacterium]
MLGPILARMAGLSISFPLLGARAVPTHVKIMLVLALSWALLPIVPVPFKEVPWDLASWAAVVIREALFGLCVGWLSQLVLSAAPLAAQIVGFQMGLGIANVMDPVENQHMSVVAQFMQLLAIWLFLALDGHHLAIWVLFQNPGQSPLTGSLGLAETVTELGRALFGSALSLAAPALLLLLFVQVGLGVLARMMPQMNIFIVAAPFQIGVGLACMGLGLGIMGSWSEKGLNWLAGAYRSLFWH